MLLNRLWYNKYKIIAGLLGLYLVLDFLQHKGLVWVMIHKNFPDYKIHSGLPKNNNKLINTGKVWVKAVNTITRMNEIDKQSSGLECDVYFDTEKRIFDVHHDEDKSIGMNLDDLLKVYSNRGLQASIWLDFKNLDRGNANLSFSTLLSLRNKYRLREKVIVESSEAELLKPFSDSGFYTSYYTPFFNPYLAGDDLLKHWVDSLTQVVNRSSVNALSGYYFQYPFLHRYFPKYPLLIWSPNDRFSLVNWWFKHKVGADQAVFIALYP